MSKEKKVRSQLKRSFQDGDELLNDSFMSCAQVCRRTCPGALYTCAQGYVRIRAIFIFIISSKELKLELMHINHLVSI